MKNFSIPHGWQQNMCLVLRKGLSVMLVELRRKSDPLLDQAIVSWAGRSCWIKRMM